MLYQSIYFWRPIKKQCIYANLLNLHRCYASDFNNSYNNTNIVLSILSFFLLMQLLFLLLVLKILVHSSLYIMFRGLSWSWLTILGSGFSSQCAAQNYDPEKAFKLTLYTAKILVAGFMFCITTIQKPQRVGMERIIRPGFRIKPPAGFSVR